MSEPQEVAFLLLEDFSQLAFACAIEPLRIANLVAERPLYRWTLLSEDGGPIRCSNGAAMIADGGLAPQRPGAWLFAVSGVGVERRGAHETLGYLRREQRRGVRIGAICSGAHVLARAGLLDGRPCAIHWAFHDAFAELFPKVALRRSVFVADTDAPTASGGSAAADLMLHLIAQQHGDALAAAVADQMVYPSVRDGHASQRASHRARHRVSSEPLRRALALMEQQLETPVTTAAIAAHVGVTPRQLERLFGQHLNTSPKRFYRDLRLQKARNLLQQTNLPMIEVALACGFSSAPHFARCYRQVYGVAPSAERLARAS